LPDEEGLRVGPAARRGRRGAVAEARGVTDPEATAARRIRVLVVDEAPAIRAALRALLAGPAIDVVGTSAGAQDAVAQAAALRPDVVTMEVTEAGGDA